MSAVLHAAPQTRLAAPNAADGSHTPDLGAKGSRRCPECLAAVKASAAAGFRNIFCCPAHRQAWHNRATVRGRVLVPLVLAARVTRDGSRGDRETGRRAARQARALMQRYAEEDRAAGRMPADEYAALRHRFGHDDALA